MKRQANRSFSLFVAKYIILTTTKTRKDQTRDVGGQWFGRKQRLHHVRSNRNKSTSPLNDKFSGKFDKVKRLLSGVYKFRLISAQRL